MSDPPRVNQRPKVPIGALTAVASIAFNGLVGWVLVSSLPADAGYEAGRAAGVVFGTALLASMGCAFIAFLAWPSSRTVYAGMAALSLCFPCGAVFFAFRAVEIVQRHAAEGIADAERHPPESVARGDRNYLVHAALGFEVLAPDGLELVEDDEVTADVFARHPEMASSMAIWRWTRGGAAQFAITVSVARGATDAEGRRRAMEDTSRGLTDHLAQSGAQVLEDRSVSERERLVRAVSPTNGGVVFTRMIAYERGDRYLVVMASGTTLATTELDAIVESLRQVE